MDQPIQLIPLVCLQCSTPIPADVDETAWVCAQCGQGMALDEENGLLPLNVKYSNAIAPNQLGRPFWVSEGRVQIRRETFGNNQNREAEAFWSRPRRFFTPAYSSSLEALLAQATQFLQNEPAFQPGPPVRFAPATLPMKDIYATAEFIVVAIESGRRDQLKRIDLKLELTSPELWILP